MGFTVLPEPIKSGVYYDQKLDFIILVCASAGAFMTVFMEVEVLYKKNQKYPKYIAGYLIKNEFVWIGEL